MSSIALTITLLGVLLLRLAWRRPSRAPLRLTGWLLLAASVWAWSRAAGAEFGVTYSLATLAFAAWLLAGVNAERRATARRSERIIAGPSLADTTTAHKVGTFLAVALLAAVSTALVTIAAARLLPIGSGSQMATAALAYPALWGIAAYWLCAHRRLLRDSALLFALGALSALGIFLS